MSYAVATRTITQSGTNANLSELKTLIDSGVVAAARSTAYTLGTVRKNDSEGTAWWYQCTTAGTSGSDAPTWPTTEGGTVTDGTVVWTARKAPTYVATGTTGNIRTEYKLETYNLNITGTQTHDPDSEQLTFNEVPTSTSPVLLTGSGVYNLGVETTINGATRYSKGTAIVNSKALGSVNGFNGSFSDSAVVRVNSGTATWTWKGGVISSPTAPRIQDGSWDCYEGVYDCRYNSSSGIQPTLLINSAADTLNIRNFTIVNPIDRTGCQINIEKAPNIFDGVVLYHGSGVGTFGATIESPVGTSTPIALDNFSPAGGGVFGESVTGVDFTFWRRNHLKAVNALNGSASPCYGMDVKSNNANNIGLVNFWKKAAMSIKDASGAAVQNALVWLRDTDNGDRPADYRGFSWAADRTYNWTTDAAGAAASQEILLGCKVKRTASTRFADVESSFRCPSGAAGNDVFTFSVWSYGHGYAPVPASLRGIGSATVSGTLITDSTIAQASRATVAAYTTLDTLDKLRDYLKYLKTTTTYVETPSVSSELCSVSGNKLNLGSYDVTADGAAGAVFALAGNAMAIKAATLAAGSVYTYLQGSGALVAPACSEGMTFDGFASVTLATLPDAATVKNSAQGIRITTAGTYDLSAWTLTGNTKDITVTATSGTVTIRTGGNTGWTINNTGGAAVVRGDAVKTSIEVTGLVAGSRVQVYNVTDAAELHNGIVPGTSLSVPFDWFSDKTIRIRAVYCSGTTCYDEYTATGLATRNGAAFIAAQYLCPVYAANGIDGSTCTEFSADYPTVHLDISDGDGVTSVPRLYAFYNHTLMTEDGIRTLFKGMDGVDQANYKIDVSVVDLRIDNVSATPVRVIGGRLYRSDGSTVIAANSGSIQMEPDKAYIASSSGLMTAAAYIAPDNAGIAAVKAKTDNLPASPAAVSDVQAVASAVSALTIPTAATTAAAVRVELAAELARMDAAVSSRSTLTAGDIPEGLTAAQVWGYGSRSLTVAPSSLTAADVWEYGTRSLTVATTTDLTPVLDAIGELSIPTASANASAVWSSGTRTLTVAAGLTPEQEAKLDDIAAKTVNLPQTPASSSEVSSVASAVAALDYPTAATLAAEIAPNLNATLTAARAAETVTRAALLP